MSIHRCNICVRTSDRSMTLYPEQYFKGPYFEDPHKEGELCQECLDAINEDLYPEEDDDAVYAPV